jgi:hypothetical protein
VYNKLLLWLTLKNEKVERPTSDCPVKGYLKDEKSARIIFISKVNNSILL